MIRRHPCRHRGFTMIEVLMGVIVIGLVLTIAAQLFQMVIRAGHAAGQSHDAASSFDAAVAALRNDVWGATAAIDAAAPGASATIKLGGDGDRSVTWSVSSGTITRSEKNGPARSWTVPAEVTFAADEAGLVLNVRPGKSTPAGEVRLVRQLAVIGRLGK